MHYYPPDEIDPTAQQTFSKNIDLKASMKQGLETRPVVNQPLDEQRALFYQTSFGESDTPVHTCKFSLDDTFLACGYGDGAVRIYNLDRGRKVVTLQNFTGPEDEVMPVTALQWRPETSFSKTANVLVSAQADGSIKHWHTSSGKCLHVMQEDPENHLYSLDFTLDGSLLAAAGRDRHVRIYDEATKAEICAMKERGKLFGHANRIFCVKFNKTDQNMLASGGWDNNIFLYDVRKKGPTHAMYGPMVCGETIEFHSDGYSLVAGSYRNDNCLEVYDLRKMERYLNIDFDGKVELHKQITVMDDPDDDFSEMPQTDVDDQE